MIRRVVPAVSVILLLGTILALLTGPVAVPCSFAVRAADAAARADRVVYLGCNLSEENLVTFTANLAASDHPGVMLLDTAKSSPYNKAFLAGFRPEQVIPVGSFPEGIPDLERRLGVKTAPALEWERGPPAALWKALFPKAERVVVCPFQPRARRLQAVCLAGAARAPLFITNDEEGEGAELRRWVAEWGTKEVFAVGAGVKLCRDLPDVKVTELADEAAVAAAYLQYLGKKGAINTFVVANPADVRNEQGGMSSLAPWIALRRRAALLLTNEKGDNTAALLRAAQKDPLLARADNLILVATHAAIPIERRANPAPGKDEFIQMEPLTPAGEFEPFSFATGRLFHQDRNIVLLMLARPRLLPEARHPRNALLISNPGEGLPLLETLSRNTARELRNNGYDLKAMFGREVNKDDVRRLLPEQDIFVWEGHYRTMIDEYELPKWTELLRPSFVLLQSCLALNEPECSVLLERGAYAIVGTPTRNYASSGGAFTLAFFDALLYEDQSLGGSLRQAKNFLLCYSRLKEKRLGKDAKLAGASTRSAWAFTLWGDPTLKMPRPTPPAQALPPVRHQVKGNTITVTLPEQTYEKIATSDYKSQNWPNGRLAGLTKQVEDDDEKTLVRAVFAEVALPKGPPGKTPHLHSKEKLSSRRDWIFCWDAQRRHGYLLVIPRAKDKDELHFTVTWED